MLAPSPTYISSRSADGILSDVRSIRLAYEALQAVNVLLDEILYTILSAAQSLDTDKLKAALLRVVPTSLGKEALLEAEVELKTYLDRNTVSSTPGGSSASAFSLQWGFQLLRLKCEAYSTMNDLDEDGEAERRLYEQMKESNVLPPQASELAPAALYLTAILESICEHALGNISSVATRDSSRTMANSQDVFTALCEDDAFYATFRTLKVYEQIEQLSKAQKPRRSKSLSRSSDRCSSPTSRTPSATQAEVASLKDGASILARTRMSMESLRSNATATAIPSLEGRTSMDKGKGIRRKLMTHSRSSSEKEASEIVRAQSENTPTAEFEEDEEIAHEFDSLMRSGSTMKFSLTPDRLRTMQMFTKEKSQRAKQTRETAAQFSDSSLGNDDDTHAPLPERHRPPLMLRRVDSIIEDEESAQVASTPMSTTVATTESPRVRQASKSFTNKSTPSAVTRFRSISISESLHPRHESRRLQDRTINRSPASPPLPNIHKPVGQSTNGAVGMPTRTRRVARNRESLDLDDVMGGSDEEVVEEQQTIRRVPSVVKSPSRPTAEATPISPEKTRASHVSASAQELIAFLDEGPPEELQQSRTSVANASVISFQSSKTARSGKLSRMISKLTTGTGASQERLNGRYGDDAPKTPKTSRSLGRRPSTAFTPPPPSFKPLLASKRSFPSVVVSPPRPPHHSDGSQMPTPASIPSGMRVVSPTPTNSTTPLMSRTVSMTSSTFDDLSSVASTLRSGSMRRVSALWDEQDSVVSMSHDGSLRSQVQGANGGRCPRVVNDDTYEEGGRSLVVRTNGHVPNVSPTPRSNGDQPVSPTTPRRSPIPRKPAPLATSQENGQGPAARDLSKTREPPPDHGITASDVDDLRKCLFKASTADECRLLIDMFFAGRGFQAKSLLDDTAPSLPELPRFMSLSELDGSYAELLLSGDCIDFAVDDADEASTSSGSSVSSRDFIAPTVDLNNSPAPLLSIVHE